jgi:tRNA (guanine-N7-)-methyltransferase
MNECLKNQKKRSVKSFVLRQGRFTAAQRKAFEVHWQEFGLEADQLKNGLKEIFANDLPTVLEIGFGMGESLLEMALTNPDKNFLGIEVHRPGVGCLLGKAKIADVKNLKVVCDNAVDVVTDSLPENSLDTIQLFFPDPWPKQRHQKRRLIQAEFLAQLNRILKSGGILHCATDWEDYAKQMLSVLSDSKAFKNTSKSNDFVPRPDSRPFTKYERRGQRLSHQVWDLVFVKVE